MPYISRITYSSYDGEDSSILGTFEKNLVNPGDIHVKFQGLQRSNTYTTVQHEKRKGAQLDPLSVCFILRSHPHTPGRYTPDVSQNSLCFGSLSKFGGLFGEVFFGSFSQGPCGQNH